MTTKTKSTARLPAPRLPLGPQIGPWQTPPWTTEERLQRIEGMGVRIGGYIEYMCKVGNLTGTSAEAKEKAVIAFYEQMLVVERELGRIQEELRLE